MDAKICLQKLQYVGVLAFATTDEQGGPQVRNISAIHYEPDAIYFFTARGKDFCRELLAVPVPQEEQKHWMDVIFDEQPYLSNVYPGNTREIGIVFAIRDAQIEYFNLGVRPIFRESYTIGQGTVTPKGYIISDSCIGCGTCERNCPQGCIVPGQPFQIQQEHCLHCGNCYEKCPVSAVRKGDFHVFRSA